MWCCPPVADVAEESPSYPLGAPHTHLHHSQYQYTVELATLTLRAWLASTVFTVSPLNWFSLAASTCTVQ